MNFKFLTLILKDLGRKKFSSFLTLFAISLGILAVFVIVVIGASFENSIKSEFEKVGSNRLYVTQSSQNFIPTGESKKLNDNIVREVGSKPFVEEVHTFYAKNFQVEYRREFIGKTIWGMEFKQNALGDLGLEIKDGRPPRKDESFVMIVGPKFLEDGFSKELQIGSKISIEDRKFKIIGVTKEVGNPEDDSNVYIPLKDIRTLTENSQGISFLYIIIQKGHNIDLAAQNLKKYFDRKVGEDKIEVNSPDQILEQLSSIISVVQITLGGIALVSIIVGALGIINTMYVIVTEKTKDIGIMKSVGATNNQILILFMVQAGVFGTLGSILGIILGSFVAIGFESFAKNFGYTFLKIQIQPQVVISLLIFGFLVGVLAGFLPSKKASKLNIVDTLRK